MSHSRESSKTLVGRLFGASVVVASLVFTGCGSSGGGGASGSTGYLINSAIIMLNIKN